MQEQWVNKGSVEYSMSQQKIPFKNNGNITTWLFIELFPKKKQPIQLIKIQEVFMQVCKT